MRPYCLVLAGPTASGKSALALALAEALGGIVINADAMQCYRELRILTARPSEADEGRVPHVLYGHAAADTPVTASSWRRDALAQLERAAATDRTPILCGGTGLYLSALIDGLAAIPDCGAEARETARALLASEGAARVHARLAALDPETASRLRPSDGQRLARALEVVLGTGRGLASWQAGPGLAPAPHRFLAVTLDPGRERLADRIAARFDAMIAAGALDEVRSLAALHLPASMPLARAHGVRELAAHLAGGTTLAEARALTIAATLAYTRRQRTWLRHHILAPEPDLFPIDPENPFSAQFSECLDWISGRISSRQG